MLGMKLVSVIVVGFSQAGAALGAVIALGVPTIGSEESGKREALKLAKPLSSVEACPNISGQWVGSCSNSSGDNTSASMNIAQVECNEIVLDGDKYRIGGINHIQSANASFAGGGTVSVDWLSGANGFRARVAWGGRGLSRDFYLATLVSTDFILVDANKLASRRQGESHTEVDGTLKTEHVKQECAFERVTPG